MPRVALPSATATVLLAVATSACSPTTPGDLDDALLGEWVALGHRVVNALNTAQEVDLIEEEGWFIHMAFVNTGRHQAYQAWPGGRWIDGGPWSVIGSTLTLVYEGSGEMIPMQYQVTAENRLVLMVDNGEGWDFDDDQVTEPTHETITLASLDGTPEAALVGDWVSDTYQVTSQADPSRSADLVAEGGSLMATFGANSILSYAETWPGQATEHVVVGYYAVAGRLWVVDPAAVESLRYSFDGATLVLTGLDSYDFAGDGSWEPVDTEIRLSRL
jgi:hypothetical protein